MRFNHMELTFAEGTLDDVFRKEVDAFYGDVFGWTGVDTEVVGQLCHVMLTGDPNGDFILLAESPKPMSSPGYDHLGLLQGTRAEVDELLEKCRRWQEKDDRVQLKEYDDLVVGDLVVHAFYVRHLLPIWFDVQCMERDGKPVPV
jgi:hypothetical protein